MLELCRIQNRIMAISYYDNSVVNVLTNLFLFLNHPNQITEHPEVLEFYNTNYHAVGTFKCSNFWFFLFYTNENISLILFSHIVIEMCKIIYEYYNQHKKNFKQDFIRNTVIHFVLNNVNFWSLGGPEFPEKRHSSGEI